MKTIGTCKDCRWWSPKPIKYKTGRHCLHEKVEDNTDEDGLNVSNGEYLAATGPDFGCIHWERKEGE